MFAVWDGTTVWGTGETREDAVSNSRQWIEDDFAEMIAGWDGGKIHFLLDCAVLTITDAAQARVNTLGGDCGGLVQLGERLELAL